MPDALDFSTINPHRVYTTREVASLMRVRVERVVEWIEQGALPAMPRLLPRSRYRILGSTLLALAGVSASQSTETPAARTKRAAAAREAIRRMK